MVPMAKFREGFRFQGSFIAIRLFALVALILCSFSALADFQWSDNFTWDRARVVAPQQNSWSFRSSYQSFDSRYGSTGQVQALGRPFDRTWTWGQIMSAETSQASRAVLQKYQQDNHLTNSDIAAQSTFDLKRQETTMEMSWAYGLSERWMIGVLVPVSLVDTQLSPTTTMTSSLSNALHSSAGASNADVRRRVQALVQSRLASEGYSPLQSRTQNLIVGDVSLMNQFALWQNPNAAFSLQQITRIPSAPNNNVADYIRYSRGDGQIDLGLAALADYQWRRFLFGARVGYTKSLPDTQKMRVPASADSSQVVDRNVRRDLGDLVSVSFETFYSFARRWKINGGYLGFFKGADHYSGDVAEAAYAELGADTNQQLHMARAGVSYLLGSPSSRNGVDNKWVANFNFYQPVAGLNISEGPQAALELQAFF